MASSKLRRLSAAVISSARKSSRDSPAPGWYGLPPDNPPPASSLPAHRDSRLRYGLLHPALPSPKLRCSLLQRYNFLPFYGLLLPYPIRNTWKTLYKKFFNLSRGFTKIFPAKYQRSALPASGESATIFHGSKCLGCASAFTVSNRLFYLGNPMIARRLHTPPVGEAKARLRVPTCPVQV